MSKSHESTPAFDFPIADTGRVVCGPAAAHHRVRLYAARLPVPSILGWATIMVELIGGLMILAGALIPLATVPMAVVLLVAIFTVHLTNGFSSIKLQSFDAAGAHFG
jgi:uncharacterized membrane protein YphA (DoxX/SURF4 family)